MTIHIETASSTDGFGAGPHPIAVVGTRTVRGTVTFLGDGCDFEASIVARDELTPEECAALIA